MDSLNSSYIHNVRVMSINVPTYEWLQSRRLDMGFFFIIVLQNERSDVATYIVEH